MPSRDNVLETTASLRLKAPWMLLYSGLSNQNSGQQSVLASDANQITRSESLKALEAPMPGQWFGYLGYEALHAQFDITPPAESFISLPVIHGFCAATISRWHHEASEHELAHQTILNERSASNTPNKVKNLNCNLPKNLYINAVQNTLEQIHSGAFYQANITRKFYGECEHAIDAFSLFRRLCELSPSPFSAYYQLDDETAILSSSPEGFLQVDEAGTIITRPIKGSAPIGTTGLGESVKDRAENLMIVDLMRNDLSHVCKPGSIATPHLFDVHQFATIQQMISTVSGQLREDASLLDVIHATFPPGSMTGAPKRAAMQWCAGQEKMARGVYSGALGWLDVGARQMDLSVIIRTLIIQGNRFEFQVGSGIVADSDPMQEWHETHTKARAICAALGISTEALEAI